MTKTGTAPAAADSAKSAVLPPAFASLHPDRWTEPFWRAARERTLVCQACSACGTQRMPPSPRCAACGSDACSYDHIQPTGRVFSYIVVRRALVPELADHVPYVVALVALDDRPTLRLLGVLVEVAPEAVHIDMAVEVVWDVVDEHTTIPRFRSVRDAA